MERICARSNVSSPLQAGSLSGSLLALFRLFFDFAVLIVLLLGRCVNEREAEVVRRIFREFTSGRSPRAIAHGLNREAITGPNGESWGPSTIYGNWRRGTGIINNELYVGRLVWNRQRYVKDPETGKRLARPNPPEDWVIEEVPQLRIVDDELWSKAKDRQLATRANIAEPRGKLRLERARRPRYLLSGLLKCGACGGGFSKISRDHYGCSTARNKGTCDNLLVIRHDRLEASVLEGLKVHLMQPEAVREFVAEFHREMNRLSAAHDQERDKLERELHRTERDIAHLIEAIKAGVPGASVRDEIAALEDRRTQLGDRLKQAPAPLPRLHPNLAEIYRLKVAKLAEALADDECCEDAAAAIRSLIDEVRLVPEDRELKIELFGELGALFALANEHPRSKETGVQVTMVAGAGFEPATFRL